MKHFIIFILLMSSTLTYSQDNNGWTLFESKDGVEFYKKEADCTPENIPNQIGIIIKIVNTNSKALKVEWDLRIWYDNKEHTRNIKDQENHITIHINKKSEKKGSCDKPYGNFYIFKKFTTYTNSAELSDFKFDDIKVTKE